MSDQPTLDGLTVALPSPDVCEQILHKALRDGDMQGVHAALQIMAPQDPERAQSLLDALNFALGLRDRP